MVRLLRFAIEIFIALMLVVTSSDILYLYYSGGWKEPIMLIRWSELVCLYTFIVIGLSYCVWRVQKKIREVNHYDQKGESLETGVRRKIPQLNKRGG